MVQRGATPDGSLGRGGNGFTQEGERVDGISPRWVRVQACLPPLHCARDGEMACWHKRCDFDVSQVAANRSPLVNGAGPRTADHRARWVIAAPCPVCAHPCRLAVPALRWAVGLHQGDHDNGCRAARRCAAVLALPRVVPVIPRCII